jgi:protease IV
MKTRSVYLIAGISVSIIVLFFISVLFAKLLGGEKSSFSLGEEIGVVEVKGLIVDSHEYIIQLNKFRDNKRIKAVVLRIDSPGGVVGPTQEICEEVKKFVLKKPLIVSMGSVAASGGYYIAAPASKIVANPGTITGSIGVLMKLSNIQGLLGKVGLKSFVLKSGTFKDTGSPVRPMTREDRRILQEVIDSLHGQFVTAVSEGRKISLEEVRKIADGRIFSGEQAMQLKLVDRLGNFQDAVAVAAKMTGIKEEPKLVYPPKKNVTLLDFLIQGSSDLIVNKLKSESGISVRYEVPE